MERLESILFRCVVVAMIVLTAISAYEVSKTITW
jgi:hypothetical protein